jgi:demethylmenaquinone methyltransferase/2-methoxy-6-polyprenyl-1,4-benzoquinol methylase
MPSLEVSMQSYYAQRAREYDRVYDKPERQDDIRHLQTWLPGHFRESTVLEVACGTGYWTRFIAQVASAVVAIDSAAETLTIAESRVPKDKVSFLIGDAYRLPLDKGPFTAAFAGFWFSHVPKARQREFLRGLSAAVRPGARVVMIDNLYVEGSNHPITERDAQGNTFQTRRLDNGSVHRVLKNFPTETELREVISGLGGSIVFTRFTYYWAVEFVTTGP